LLLTHSQKERKQVLFKDRIAKQGVSYKKPEKVQINLSLLML
jgi:hypothetical protein